MLGGLGDRSLLPISGSRCEAIDGMPSWKPRVTRRGARIAVAVGLSLTCASCASLEGVPQPELNAQQLVGHQVRVTTIDGRILEFELTMVTDEGLIGLLDRVRFDEIALVERSDVSVWRTVCLVAGGLSVLAALYVAYVAYSLSTM